MAASLPLLLAFLSFCARFAVAVPTLAPRQFDYGIVPPPPPNGTIELHHNSTQGEWYLLAALDPTDYTKTKGNKTILGQHNPKSIVTLYFTVEQVSNYSDYQGYAIYSDPVAFEHHIDDPLGAVWVYNVMEPCTPGVQCFPTEIDVNGTGVVGTGGQGGNGVAGLFGFRGDLNYPFNVTGFGIFDY